MSKIYVSYSNQKQLTDFAILMKKYKDYNVSFKSMRVISIPVEKPLAEYDPISAYVNLGEEYFPSSYNPIALSSSIFSDLREFFEPLSITMYGVVCKAYKVESYSHYLSGKVEPFQYNFISGLPSGYVSVFSCLQKAETYLAELTTKEREYLERRKISLTKDFTNLKNILDIIEIALQESLQN